MQAFGCSLITSAGFRDDAHEEADFLQDPDCPSDLRFREVEVAMADKRAPVDREGHPKAARGRPEPSQEGGEAQGCVAVAGGL